VPGPEVAPAETPSHVDPGADRVLEIASDSAENLIAMLWLVAADFIDRPLAKRDELAAWLCDCGAGEAGRELAAQLLKDDDSELRRPLTRARKYES
jgi:hypothetical protein